MKNLESVASQVTIFGKPLEINHEKDTKHGVFFPFLATLLLIAIISGSAISSINDLFNYRKITVTGFRELDTYGEEVNGTLPMIAFRLNNLSYQEFIQSFQAITTNLYWFKQFGNHLYNIEPCKKKHWPMLSQKYFSENNISDYYCVNFTGIFLRTVQVEAILAYTSFIIVPYQWDAYSNDTGQWTLELLAFHQKITENKQSPFENIVKRLVIKNEYSMITQVEVWFSEAHFKTDYSFFPFSSLPKNQKSIQMQRYQLNSSELGQPDQNTQLVRINFMMDKKSLQYERNVGKIANVLSEVGGLYTSVFGTFSIVILIYYNHKLRLRLAEDMFKKSKSSIKKSDYTFFNSLAYGLSGILKPRQTSNYGKDCKRVEKNLNEVDSLMHIEFILKRLQIHEKAFKTFSDKNGYFCLSLVEKESVQSFHYNMLRIDYYDFITKQKNCMSITDAKKLYKGIGLSLQEFLQQKLKHARLDSNITTRKSRRSQSLESKIKMESQTEIIRESQEFGYHSQSEQQVFVQFKKNKAGLNILQRVINQFKEIRDEAFAIQINAQYAKVEVNLAKAFYKMSENSRRDIQESIPIIILCRLMKIICILKAHKEAQKQNQIEIQDSQKVKNNQDEENEEEFSDCDSNFSQNDL